MTMYPKTVQLIQEKMPTVFPGAVLRFIAGETQETHVFGQAALLPKTEPMTKDHLFDLASLTKVVCTTSVLLKLWDQGKIEMEAPLTRWLPAFKDDQVTIKHLLTHTAAINTWIPHRDQLDAAALRKAYLQLESSDTIGQTVSYTDTGTILLGFLLEELYQKPVTEIFQEEVLTPLGMKNSGFPPFPPSQLPMIVPTQQQPDGSILRGITHDPKARVLGNHAGNAGLFSTVDDLTLFVQLLLANGQQQGAPFFSEKVMQALAHRQTPESTKPRTYGWDLLGAPYQLFHTGYTGTFLAVDIPNKKAFIFLSNRVHPVDHRESYLGHRDEILQCYLKETAE